MINISINLLPEEEKKKFQARKEKRQITKYAVTVLVILFLVVSGFAALEATLLFILQTQKRTLDSLNNEISVFKNLEEKAVFINDRLSEGKNIEKERLLWSQVLDNLAASTPQNVNLQKLAVNLKNQPQVALTGFTPTLRDAIKYKEKLEESKFFESVSFENSSLDTTTALTMFNLKFNLEGYKVKKDVKK